MTDTNIDDFLVAVEEKESAAVKLALEAATALHESLAAKRRLAVPPLLETRPAINEMEARVVALKLDLLREPADPDQLTLFDVESLHDHDMEGQRDAS